MPAEATAPPAPSPATATPVQPGAAPPSTGVIHLDKPIDPTPPPKPGSARDALFKGVIAKSKLDKPQKEEAPKPPADAKAKPADEKPTETPTDKPAEAPKAEPQDKKASPWKLVDQFKDRAIKAELRVAELEKQFPDAKTAEEIKTRYAAIEKRNAELEEEIRYVNYVKSGEFAEKYQKPYEQAWKRAMANLSEIPVDAGNGQVRGMTVEDMAQLVQLPLTQAKEIAERKFGEYAGEVMSERKEIRRLWEAQASALEEAKKSAGERQKKLMSDWQAQNQQLHSEIVKLWGESNQAVLDHPEFGQYFKAPEGDEAAKASLEKGFKLVDSAFAANPLDPRLTPEQRSQAIKKQAVIRHRAAAFGNLTRQLKSATARVAELEKELSQYRESTPPLEGSRAPSTPGPTSTRDSIRQAFIKKAR